MLKTVSPPSSDQQENKTHTEITISYLLLGIVCVCLLMLSNHA